MSLSDQHHFTAAVTRSRSILFVAVVGSGLLLLERVQPEDHVVVVLALHQVLAQAIERRQSQDVLAFRVVNGHLYGASAQIDHHIIRTGSRCRTVVGVVVIVVAAAAVVGDRRGAVPREMNSTRSNAGPHLSPRSVGGSPTVDDCLFDVEPSLSSFTL